MKDVESTRRRLEGTTHKALQPTPTAQYASQYLQRTLNCVPDKRRIVNSVFAEGDDDDDGDDDDEPLEDDGYKPALLEGATVKIFTGTNPSNRG